MAEREESGRGAPEFDTTLKANAWWNCGLRVMSGWTGLNPSDVTLIKFKTCSQETMAVFPFGELLGHPLNRSNLHLNTAFALNLELPLSLLENRIHLILIYVYICIFLNVQKTVH